MELATGEALRVRDVILCANGPVQIDDGEFEAHPPVGMTPRLLFENAVPVVDLGERITLSQLDDDEAERVLDACSPERERARMREVRAIVKRCRLTHEHCELP